MMDQAAQRLADKRVALIICAKPTIAIDDGATGCIKECNGFSIKTLLGWSQ